MGKGFAFQITLIILALFIICGCTETTKPQNEEYTMHDQVHVFDLGKGRQKFTGIGTSVLKPMASTDTPLHTACVAGDKKIAITIINDKPETHSATIQLRNVPQGLRIVEALESGSGKGKTVTKDIKMIFVCGEYNLNVTLPGDSTLTILCEK